MAGREVEEVLGVRLLNVQACVQDPFSLKSVPFEDLEIKEADRCRGVGDGELNSRHLAI